MSCVPELRFKEFNGEWEEKKLGEIILIENSKHNPQKSKENLKCVELEHISQDSGKLLGYSNSQDQARIKNHFKKNNILFGKLRPYLKKFWLASFEGVCSTEIWVFNGKNSLNKFIFQFIQTDKFNYISNISSGSKMPRSDWNFMKEMNFNIPSLEEQEKIANFLSKIDEKIAILEDKLQLLENYKKGITQQLFSQELRFKDDEGNSYPGWEEKILGDLGSTYTGLSGKTKDDFGKGKPYITYKSIFDSQKINLKKVDFVEINSNESQNKVEYGDIFFTTSSETPEEVGMASVLLNSIDECYLNSFCFGFRLNSFEEVNPIFFSFYLRSSIIRTELNRLAQGSTRFNLSKNSLMGISIMIPILKEQEKIANYLSKIDEKIEKVNFDIKITENFKKGLLQKLFC